jgi:hypothetical protein
MTRLPPYSSPAPSPPFDAGDRRQVGRLRVVPSPDEDVDEVHARGTNMYQRLSLGHVRIGQVLKLQRLWAAGLLDHDRLHEASRTICVQRAAASSTRSASYSDAEQKTARRDWCTTSASARSVPGAATR